MWIEERKNGFRMYERYTDASGVSHKISVSMPNNTRVEQKKAREALRTQVERLSGMSRRYKLREVADAYQKAQSEQFKKNTCIASKSLLDNFLKKIPNMYADELTAGQIRDVISKNWTSNTTRNAYVRRVKAFLRWAFANDYIQDLTPVQKLIFWPDTQRKEKIKEKYLEKEELTAVINAIEPEHWKLTTEILALSGMRIGELIALEVSDVDFRNKEIHVTKTYGVISHEITTPKTSSSNRDVHMQPELLAAMKKAVAWHRKVTIMTGSREPYLMLNGEGRRLTYDAFLKAFKKATTETVGRSLTPHALRHTHVALMAAAGVPIEALSRRLGHSGTGVTREIYFHVTKDLKNADAALFDAVSLL